MEKLIEKQNTTSNTKLVAHEQSINVEAMINSINKHLRIPNGQKPIKIEDIRN